MLSQTPLPKPAPPLTHAQALRGAASGFGVVTQFVVRTHPEPDSVVQYEYTLASGSHADMAPLFSAWLDLMRDPKLDRRFGSLFLMVPTGAVIAGTFYGTKTEFEATDIPDRFPGDARRHLVLTDWRGSVAHEVEKLALFAASLPAPFYSKSLALRREDVPSPSNVRDLFRWVDTQEKGTPLWFIIFDSSGGAVGDVPSNATSFAHRDKILYYQSYFVALPLTTTSRDFVNNFHTQLIAAAPAAFGTYPGYVDPDLPDAPRQYWGANLPRLQEIKRMWDPADVFHNPQSVRPMPERSGGQA